MPKNEKEVETAAPAIVGVKPLGTQILFEELTQKEILGTKLVLGGTTSNKDAPQAYVLSVGPKVDPDWGIRAGQRVVISGNYTPIPECAGSHGRKMGVCEPFNIKAILLEDK
jgi:hypothetical protein